MHKMSCTVNLLIQPRGLICKKLILSGGLFGGRAYSKGGLFQNLASSSNVDRKDLHNFVSQLAKISQERLLRKRNSIVNHVSFCFFVSSNRM